MLEQNIRITTKWDYYAPDALDKDCEIINWLAEYQVKYGNGIDANGLVWGNHRIVGSWPHESIYAHDRGKLIGGALFSDNDDWIYLDRAFILPEYRGQGIYSAIVKKIDECAEQHNIRGIEVHTWDFEAPNIYEHLGFTRGCVFPDKPKRNTEYHYFKLYESTGK